MASSPANKPIKEEYNSSVKTQMMSSPDADDYYNVQTATKVKADYQFVLTCLIKQVPMLYLPDTYVNYRSDGLSTQLTLKQTLKESYVARRGAGVNFFQRSIGFFVVLSVHLLYRGWIKKRIKVFFNNPI